MTALDGCQSRDDRAGVEPARIDSRMNPPNETNPNYFVNRNWFGFVFLL